VQLDRPARLVVAGPDGAAHELWPDPGSTTVGELARAAGVDPGDGVTIDGVGFDPATKLARTMVRTGSRVDGGNNVHRRSESPAGAVSAMNLHRPGAVPVLRLTPIESLPTVDEIMTLRRIPAASAIATMRTTGSVRFPQSGVEGRFSSSSAGDDRLLQVIIDHAPGMTLLLDGDGRLRSLMCQREEPRAASAPEDDGENVVHRGDCMRTGEPTVP